MSTHASYTEILKMMPDEIGRELTERQLSVAKQRLLVQLGSQKNTASFRNDRRQVARLQTALSQKKQAPAQVEAPKKTAKKVLKKTDSDSTLAAPASA